MFGRSERAGGIDVRIERGRLSMPNVCALCERAAETRRLVPDGPGLYSMVSVPYCIGCAAGSRSPLARIAAAGLGMALGAVVVGAVLGAVVELPIVWTAILAVLAVAIVSVAAAKALWPRSTAIVSLRTAGGQAFVLHCPNAAWGAKVAERSGGTAVDRKSVPRDRLVPIALGAAFVFGIAAAYIAWRAVHAPLVVDNTLETPVQIWIDGEPAEVVEPNTERDVPPSIWVRSGERSVGYTAPGATTPPRVSRADLSGDGVLFSPGGDACYWRVVDVYGSAASWVDPGGPMPRSEVYSLRGVDSVFVANPSSVQVRSRYQSETRTALWPYALCTDLVRGGCPSAAIDQLLACVGGATDENAMNACEADAMRACGVEP